MLNRPQEYEKMAQTESDLWWYRALHRLVLDTIKREIQVPNVRIMDAGCGTGGLMLFLREHGCQDVNGFDLSEHAVAACRSKGLPVENDSLVNIAKRCIIKKPDVIVSNDTLYFLKDDERRVFLAGCYESLRPGGILILNLPALAAFQGIHDVSVGIGRRFTRPVVRGLFRDSGFTLVRETYWPFFASPPIYAARLCQRIKMRINKKFNVHSDVSLPPAWLNNVLYGLTCWENQWLRRKPWGSSLFVAATRSVDASQ